MTSTPAQFAMKMAKAADNVKKAPSKITQQAAITVKRSVTAQLAIAAPKRRLNVGKRGAFVGVRYDLPTSDTALVRMTGPAHILERPTKAHRIPQSDAGRKRGRAKRGTKKPLVMPGIGFRMYANHPGTRGKYPWRKGVTAALPLVDRLAAEHYFKTVRDVFR